MKGPQSYTQEPRDIITSDSGKVFCFNIPEKNINDAVVQSFGAEWKKFHRFSDEEIEGLGNMYFDILSPEIVNPQSYCIDFGCGTGRFTKYLSNKIGFMEAIDPSEAVFTASELLKGINNVRLTQASIDNIPFPDQTFDFGMCIGVLHSVPDPQTALNDCVKKIKKGGYFYLYLYYNLENKGWAFKLLFKVVSVFRKWISALPIPIKKGVCDVIAITVYMPLVLAGRLLSGVGLKKLAQQLPLSTYQNQTFFIMRNDALDRFGTAIEHRFSKNEIEAMMTDAGLDEILFSDQVPYWHAVGRRKS